MFRKIALFFLAIGLVAPAFAANSVFVEGAFEAQFSIALFDVSNKPIKNWGGDKISFRTIPESEGVPLINSLGDPSFNANNCPGLQEKREYYASYQSEGVATHVGCTNGSSFNLRIRVGGEQGGIRPNDDGDTGIVRFTDITTSPPSTATGTGSSNNTPSFKVVLTPLTDGSGTIFARVSDDYMITTGTGPTVGTQLTPGSTQNLNLNVRYRLTSFKNGTLQGTLYNGDQVLATTTAANTSSLGGENTQGFNFPSFVIPNSGNLTIRGELRAATTGAVVASSSVSWPIFQVPQLTAAPNLVRFNSTAGTTKQTDSITVITTSASALNYTASIVNTSKWLSLSAPTGSISTTATLPLAMDPTGLAPGYYFDTVRIATSLGTLNVPVALQVGARPASLNVEPNGLRFDVRQGQGSPISQTLNVYHSGPAGSSTNWSARVLSGANLIRLSSSNGTATPGNPSPISVSLASTATDTLGPAQAVIEVSSPNTLPEYVTLWANVTATTTPAPPILTPVSLVLVAPQGGAPDTQRAQVNLSELAPTNFTFNFSGGTNLTATAVTSSASTTSPGAVDITFAPPASAAIGGGGPIFFNVTSSNPLRTSRLILLTLPPSGTACVANAVWVRETSLIERFSIPAGLPQPLTVQLYDQCGNRLKGGSVAASFSNGDPSLRLDMDEATGDFFTTWTPQTALNAQMKVTLWPTYGNLFSKAFNINGTVTGNAAPPPSLVSLGLLNNLNPIIGAPLAPGTIAQVYGDNFYSRAGFESAPAPPLDPRFKGARLLVSGTPAPFYYLSKTQAAAQIPTELTPGRTYSAMMDVNGVYSVPQSFEVVNTTPGTVSLSGSLVAQHAADYKLVTPQNPAKPNESLIMYLVGMGATNPNVATGAPAPGGPLGETAVKPTVTIDGQNSTVQFAGLTPGFAGLYQINFVVPSNARDGDLDVVIKQDGLAANATKLTVKK